MNRPTPGHSSQTISQYKQYLEAMKSKSRPKDDVHTRNSRASPINRIPKQETQASPQQLLQLQKRYVQLEDKYKELLSKAKTRNQEHDRLKEQLQRYQRTHERDTEQIEKLRCIIGLINKKTAQTQVNEEDMEWNHLRQSRGGNKFEESTEDDIRFKHSAEKFHPKDRQDKHKGMVRKEVTLVEKPQRMSSSRVRKSREKPLTTQTSTKGILLQYQKQLKQGASGPVRKLTNSPYSQLRFVPGFKK